MEPVIKNPNWWRRRTTLERCFTLIGILAHITIIALLICLVSLVLKNQNQREKELQRPAMFQVSESSPLKQHELEQSTTRKLDQNLKMLKDEVCLTPECIHTASMVLSKMKPDIKPCDDFYRFACGSYLDKEIIPDDQTSIDTLSVISDKLQEQLKELITEERPQNEPKILRLPNLLYKACMNKSLIETLGTKPITDLVESLGGWPVIKGDAWDPKITWTWQEATVKFRQLGFSKDYVIGISTKEDLKNNTRYILTLYESNLGLSSEFLIEGLNDTLVEAYFDYMVDIAVLFGANKDVAKNELGESLQFEIALANISWPNEKPNTTFRNSSDLYNIRTIRMLQETYPYVQWLDYINALLPEGLKVDEDEPINLSVPSFFDELGPLLAKTPKRVIANYMMWRIHAFSVAFLPEDLRKREFQYTSALWGLQEQQPRWKECVDKTAGSFPIMVGSLYVRKYFKEDSKANALEMVNNIKSVFNEILDTADWMDPKTKLAAKSKLQKMTPHIGYPNEMLDNKKLERFRFMDIDPSKYFQSFLKMNVFGTDNSFIKLRLPVNKTDWTRHAEPTIVNAFYSPYENSIQLPAGILQGHFFNAQRPKYMNYGAIGSVIGHEITHGFDDQGREFDADGNLINWWEPSTQEAFLERAKCIIYQYGNYTERQTGLNLDGINMLGENIADNGGVKESYIAYRKWAEKNGQSYLA